jgi:hypothetical protein
MILQFFIFTKRFYNFTFLQMDSTILLFYKWILQIYISTIRIYNSTFLQNEVLRVDNEH